MPESASYDEQGREVVRVKDVGTGHKYTELAHVVAGSPDAYQVLKQDAVDAAGRLLEPEFNDSPASSGQKATTQKES